MHTLYKAHGHAEGGRNGRASNQDGTVAVELSIPMSMGGPGRAGTTTPEDLFAVGYAACFGSACEFVAKGMGLSPSKLVIESAVAIGTVEGGAFQLEVTLTARVGGLSQPDAERLVHRAHEVCPYSRAVRGNVQVHLDVVGE
jgi:Ohr subfamily peroxiredoxin